MGIWRQRTTSERLIHVLPAETLLFFFRGAMNSTWWGLPHACTSVLAKQGSTGCWVLGRQEDWSCFNLILKASLFLLLRGGQDCGICACVCWSICLVYSVGNGEEMCFQFYLIYSACLRFYLKLSFLCCCDRKQDFEIKVWVTEKANIKIKLYLWRKNYCLKIYEENGSSFFHQQCQLQSFSPY